MTPEEQFLADELKKFNPAWGGYMLELRAKILATPVGERFSFSGSHQHVYTAAKSIGANISILKFDGDGTYVVVNAHPSDTLLDLIYAAVSRLAEKGISEEELTAVSITITKRVKEYYGKR
jgi:hypothetical protein